jgi:PhnB protein
MQLNPYLTFDGQCEAAFNYYADVLRGRIAMKQTYGESPAAEHVSPSARDKMIHMRLEIGDQVLMGSDCPPENPYEGIKGNSVSLNVASIAEAERIWKALSKNGSVTMPFQQTFWAARFGMCTDQFGVPWMVNCEQDAAAK